jgi:hypothetical protein
VSSTDVLLNIATTARLFYASDGTGFADLIIDGHRETWPLRGKRFQAWLRQQYYERTWDAPSPAVLNAALNVLEAQAQFHGPELKVSLRLAEQDDLIYLDLADEFWHCVEIGAHGWRIAEDPPVRRSAGMQPLPLPLRGGSIEALAPFLNLASENDFVLVVAWLLGALRAGGPYPVLAIAGEQGSAKTVLSKLLRAVIDPSVAPVRALPRDERELFIAASNGYVLAFDNLSGLPPWLSDTLCRLTSGGAFSTRRLFTDQDEILFTAARPVILNGIEDVITRPDLADRAILLTLAPIAKRQRRPEHALWWEFELARPHILGALLDAAAQGLHMLPRVRLKRLSRMADFALWATACESAFRPAGTLETAYSNNRARRDREYHRRRSSGGPYARDHGRQSAMEGKRIGPSAGRHQPVWLAKEPARTGRPAYGRVCVHEEQKQDRNRRAQRSGTDAAISGVWPAAAPWGRGCRRL